VTVFQITWFQLFQNGEYHLQRGIRERLESLDLSIGSPRTTSVEFRETTTFFGTPHLPDPVLTPEEVLEATKANQPATDDVCTLFRALEQAIPVSPNESAVDDFAAAIFCACGCTISRRCTYLNVLFFSHTLPHSESLFHRPIAHMFANAS
jgi:hypothetical protein